MKPRVPASKYKSFIVFVDFLKSNNANQFFEFLERDVFYEDPEWWVAHAFTWSMDKEGGHDFWLSAHGKWVAIVDKLQRAKQMSIEQNMKELSQAMKDDPAYAWSWHCNIAMAHYDEMAGAGYVNHESIHKVANKGAARLMKLVFDVDTSECKEYKAIFNAN